MKARQKRGASLAGRSGEAREAGGSRILQTIGVGMGGRLVVMAVSLITLPLVARTLGPAQFGVWTAALAYVGIFASITEFGLTNAATQRMASDPDNEGEWLRAASTLRTTLAIGATVVAAIGIPLFLSGDDDRAVVSLILLLTIPAVAASSLMSVFGSRLRPTIPVIISIGQAFLWLALVLSLAFSDASPVGFAVAYSGVLLVVAAVQVSVTRKLMSPRGADLSRRWRGLLEIALPVGLAGLFITVYYKIDAVLLIELSSSEEAGVYGAAYRFLEPLVFVPGVVMSGLFPVLSAVHATDRERFDRLVRRGAEMMAFVSLPLLAVTIVLSGQIVDLMYGEDFARAATILPILMGAFVAICFGTLAGFLAPIVGLQWRTVWVAGIGAVVNVVANVLLIPRYGAEGSAWVTLLTEALTMTLILGMILRDLRLRVDVGRLLGLVAACAVMAGAMLLVEPLGLLPALVAGGVTLVGAVLAFGIIRPDELRALRQEPS